MSDKRYRTCEHTTKVRWRLYRCQRCDKRKRHVACEDCHGVFCETCGRPNKRGKKERLSEVAKIVAEAKHRLGVDCGCDECLQKRFPVAMDQIIKDAYALAIRQGYWFQSSGRLTSFESNIDKDEETTP